VISTLFAIWLVWCLGNLALMALVVPRVPAYTGFRIVMPEYLKQALTMDEYFAVLAHERGHRHHRHAWWNYARVCVFWFPGKVRLAAQEIEADDYALGQGCALALATALRKLSRSPLDWVRAHRLEDKDWAAYLRKGYSTEEGEG
jgi:beta-lactamase regulating signal transducer with metallopeptidase domain